MSPIQKPDVRIRASDYDRLASLTEFVSDNLLEAASFLRDELARARVVPDGESSGVQMGAHVRFRDHGMDRVHDLQLVWPAEADARSGRISILTPVGAALIGLSEGATMPWRDRNGSMKTLTVLAVHASIPA